jgi:uncharacterized protein (DUF302 family)
LRSSLRGTNPKEKSMFTRLIRSVSAVCFALALCAPSFVTAEGINAGANLEDGIVKVKSAYSMDETIARVKQDIASKGITFFSAVDQYKLAADAGINLRPSTLLIFGNPPLGTLFIKANPIAGLDWPVRLLVYQDEKGDVWTAYTDFAYIARRHHIQGMDIDAFQKASGVIASITSSVTSR